MVHYWRTQRSDFGVFKLPVPSGEPLVRVIDHGYVCGGIYLLEMQRRSESMGTGAGDTSICCHNLVGFRHAVNHNRNDSHSYYDSLI